MTEGRVGSWTPIVAALLLLAVLGAAVGTPRWLDQRRTSKERSASEALRDLTKAESVFRTDDRDRNGVRDFWTGDVSGLYAQGLIPRELAEADAAPLVPLVPEPIPYRGYYFKALESDGEDGFIYRQITDPKSGAVHNLERFGFVAYPAAGFAAPRRIMVINENNTIFRTPSSNPVPGNWPSDRQIVNSWSKIE